MARLNWVVEAGAGRVLEDRVAVGVEGDGCAEMLHETLDEHEVMGVLLLAEEGVDVPVASSNPAQPMA